MKKKFNLTLTGENQIIKDHIIHGQKLLPGLAYIDIIYQLAQNALGFDFKQYVLKRLSIFNPLSVRDSHPVHIAISLEEAVGYWKVVITDDSNGAMTYITAELHPETVRFDERKEIDLFKESSEQVLDIESLYAQARKIGMVHQGMIKARGAIYLKDGDALIDLQVNQDHNDAVQYLFHPALIDGAAMASGSVQSGSTNNDELYLPLYYESFSCCEPLQTHCYAVVDQTSLQIMNDIRKIDIKFFDGSGKQVGALKGMTAKLVRDKEHLNAGTAAVSQPATPAGGSHSDMSIQAGGNLEETVRNIFAHYLNMPAYQVDNNTSFYELGLQSSQMMAVVQNIEQAFEVALSPTLLFECTTIRELTVQLTGEYGIQADTAGSVNHRTREAARKTIDISEDTVPVNNQLHHASQNDDIAVIGLVGRYPRAFTVDELWRKLLAGEDCVGEIPKERWDNSKYFNKDKTMLGKTYCKWGGFIDDMDQFDPLFFNISPSEAASMDPQERLFMESVWHLFERTGYTRDILQQRYNGKIGVFVGAMGQFYNLEAITPGTCSAIANRISYHFNFTGPSMAIDTMCCSSTTAIHQAFESLKRGECRMAIAGGVNIIIHPKKYLTLSMAQMLGSHADSRSFSDGDGFIPAEAVGAVLLKPLSQAEQDNDTILAVIKSSAINNSGQSNGFTSPDLNTQAQLYEDHFRKAGIDPRTISYVEAASMGKPLGDTVEVNALTKTFKKFTTDRNFCALGSVKSNIGHAEAASGITQLSKVILQLHHKTIVPTVKAEPLNPNINFDNTPFYIPKEVEEWKRPVVTVNGEERESPRRATLFSYGAGGTNVHVIVEEYIPVREENDRPPFEGQPQVMVMSAKDEERLQTLAHRMLDFVKGETELSLSNTAYTLQTGREVMDNRLALIVATREEFIQGLEQYLDKGSEKQDLLPLIPMYTGTADDADHHYKNVLSGNIGDTVAQMLAQEKNLDKIAAHWTRGGKIYWDALHEGIGVRKIPLPVYPFAKRRCWITPVAEWKLMARLDEQIYTDNTSIKTDVPVKDRVVTIVSRVLGMMSEELDLTKPMSRYGVSLVILTRLLQQLRAYVSSSIELVKLQQCRSIQDIIDYIVSLDGAKPRVQAKKRTTAKNAPVKKENVKKKEKEKTAGKTALTPSGKK